MTTLLHVIGGGSVGCEVVGAIDESRIGSGERPVVLNRIFIDSALQTVDLLTDAQRAAFLALRSDPRPVLLAAHYPDSAPWPHYLGDPRGYEAPPPGMGFAHKPGNCALAVAAQEALVLDFMARARREGLARARALGGVADPIVEIWIVAAETIGATGAALVHLLPGMIDEIARGTLRIRASSLLNPALAQGSALEEYRAKFYDDRALTAAIESGTALIKPGFEGAPYAMELFFDDSRDEEIRSVSAHVDFFFANLIAFLECHSHLLAQAIDVHNSGLQTPADEAARLAKEREAPAARLVLFDAHTLELRKDQVAARALGLAKRRLAEALLGGGGAAAPGEFLQHRVRTHLDKLVGAVGSVLRGTIAQFVQARTQDATVANHRAVLGQDLGGYFAQLATQALKPCPAPEGAQLAHDLAQNGSLDRAAGDLALASEVLRAKRAELEQIRRKREQERLQAQEYLDRDGALPGAALPQLRDAVRKLLAANASEVVVREAMKSLDALQEHLGALASNVESVRGQLAVVHAEPLTSIVSSRPRVLPLVSEAVVDRTIEGQGGLHRATTLVERQGLLRELLIAVDPGAIAASLDEAAQRALAEPLAWTASDWADREHVGARGRSRLLENLAGGDIARLVPVPGIPGRRHAWAAATPGLARFLGEVRAEIDGKYNDKGTQPPQSLIRPEGLEELVVIRCQMGLRSEHLQLTHECRDAWRKLRAQGFPFTMTAQPVAEIPELELPSPRHLAPPPPPRDVLGATVLPFTTRGAGHPRGTEPDDFIERCRRELENLDARAGRSATGGERHRQE